LDPKWPSHRFFQPYASSSSNATHDGRWIFQFIMHGLYPSRSIFLPSFLESSSSFGWLVLDNMLFHFFNFIVHMAFFSFDSE